MAARMIADTGSFLNFEHLAEGLGLSSYGLSILKIIGVDIVLAGDNAVVIALACRTLPPRQRVVGLILGTAAAVVMRILFTLVVARCAPSGNGRRPLTVLDRHQATPRRRSQ